MPSNLIYSGTLTYYQKGIKENKPLNGDVWRQTIEYAIDLATSYQSGFTPEEEGGGEWGVVGLYQVGTCWANPYWIPANLTSCAMTGAMEGMRYFETPMLHGIFVWPQNVEALSEATPPSEWVGYINGGGRSTMEPPSVDEEEEGGVEEAPPPMEEGVEEVEVDPGLCAAPAAEYLA